MLGNKQLIKEMDSIIDNGYTTYNDIPTKDLEHLLALCMEEEDVEWAVNTNVYKATVKLLSDNDGGNEAAIAEAIKKSIKNYFYVSLCDAFHDRVAYRTNLMYEEKGMFSTIDKTNGEVTWV